MHEAIAKMINKYECRGLNDYVNALREILQEIALLGLWRGKFFEKAAFYGGTALRVLYGLDRYSEDMDFSLIEPTDSFDITRYMSFIKREAEGFGFNVQVERINKAIETAIESAFLKAETLSQLLAIETQEEMLKVIPKGKVLKIKVEVDTDPPPDFETSSRYLLNPIPFAVRAFEPPDLFAGKMHAILCRRWKNRVKGRDWYDLIWYAANHPELRLKHLERRMQQTGDWELETTLTRDNIKGLLLNAINRLDVEQARKEVEPFVKNPENLDIWSRQFFFDVATKIKFI